MLKEIISPTASFLPVLALLLFVGVAVLVVVYMITDRRREHRRRMESMPLDDGTRTDAGKDQG
jgi:hypothetical protein